MPELEVGRIGRAHGLRGEVLVQLTSDYPEVRLAPGSRLRAGDREVVVRSARPHQDRWIVVLEGVATREGAQALTGRTLTAEAFEDADAFWVHDLVGSEVVEATTGIARGRVRSVVANPAHDLLELESGVLVPMVFVVSCSDGTTVIDPPAGLFELDRPG